MFVVNQTFPLGQFVMTRGVNDLVADDEAFAKFITESLIFRHQVIDSSSHKETPQVDS